MKNVRLSLYKNIRNQENSRGEPFLKIEENLLTTHIYKKVDHFSRCIFVFMVIIFKFIFFLELIYTYNEILVIQI